MAATKLVDEVSEWTVYSDSTGDDDYDQYEASFATESEARAFSKNHKDSTGVWCSVVATATRGVLYVQTADGAWVRSPLNDYSVTDLESMSNEQKQALLLPA